MGFPYGLGGKESASNTGAQVLSLGPEHLSSRERLPLLVSLPGE